jgi:hypothetical protein
MFFGAISRYALQSTSPNACVQYFTAIGAIGLFSKKGLNNK